MARAGYLHKVAIGLEPSHRSSAVGGGVGVVFFTALLVAGLLLHTGSWPQGWPRPPVESIPAPVPEIVLGVLALFVSLMLIATVVYGRRWQTYRRVVALTADPDVDRLMPEVETEPVGPFAPAQPPPRVIFEKLKRWKKVRPLQRVTDDRNVIGVPPLRIVYLRVFENGARARTFAQGAWREFGHVRLLRSAASVSPREFRDHARTGGLSRLVIDSEDRFRAALARPSPVLPPGWNRLQTVAGTSLTTRDKYGAYPMRAVLCGGGFWKRALDILLDDADLVVLDMSGYQEHYRGTQFELQRIVDAVPVERVVLLADQYSRQPFLEQQVHLAWSRMAAGSPNAGRGTLTIRGAVTDFFHQSSSSSSSSTPGSGSNSSSSSSGMTRTELLASRRQTRWLLRDVQHRLPARYAPASRDAQPWAPPARSTPRPPTAAFVPTRSSRSRSWPIVTATLVAGIAAVAGLVLLFGLPGSDGPGTGLLPVSGISATVAPGTEWNVRSGPTTSAAVIGQVSPGDELVVACTSGSWSRLADPLPDGYVSSKGLQMTDTPPRC